MATTPPADKTRTHLERLATTLRHRNWHAAIIGTGRNLALRVTNPEAQTLRETIVCSGSGDDSVYLWSWREVIGPTDKVGEVAIRITKVLGTRS